MYPLAPGKYHQVPGTALVHSSWCIAVNTTTRPCSFTRAKLHHCCCSCCCAIGRGRPFGRPGETRGGAACPPLPTSSPPPRRVGVRARVGAGLDLVRQAKIEIDPQTAVLIHMCCTSLFIHGTGSQNIYKYINTVLIHTVVHVEDVWYNVVHITPGIYVCHTWYR